MRRVVRLGAVLGALILGTTGAHAQAPAQQPNGELTKLLREGAEAARAKRWGPCIEAYAHALGLEEAPTTQGELGLCEEAQGRNVDAFRHLSAAMRAPAADRTKEPWKRFGTALTRVAARVAQVFLAVDPPQAAVVVDGRPMGKTEGRAIVLDAGSHTFGARLAGYNDAIETRVLQPGDLPTVYLQLRTKPSAAPVPSVLEIPRRNKRSATEPAAAWYAPAWSPRGVFVAMTYVGAATTVVSGATAIGLEIDRASLRSQVTSSACGPDASSPPSSCEALVERRVQRDAAVDFTVGAAVTTGLMAGAAGLTILFDRRPSSPSIAPTVSTHGGGIVVVGAW